MSSLKKGLAGTGARLAGIAPEPVAAPPPPSAEKPSAQDSRLGTAPITVHLPEGIRRQVKGLAAEQGRTVADLVAEALNLLFANYGKPESAPVKKGFNK